MARRWEAPQGGDIPANACEHGGGELAIHQTVPPRLDGRTESQLEHQVVGRARVRMQMVAHMRRQANPEAFGVEWAGVAEAVGAGVRILWEGGGEEQGPLPAVEIYTDRSAALGKAGWGMVVVANGVEMEAASGPMEVRENARIMSRS